CKFTVGFRVRCCFLLPLPGSHGLLHIFGRFHLADGDKSHPRTHGFTILWCLAGILSPFSRRHDRQFFRIHGESNLYRTSGGGGPFVLFRLYSRKSFSTYVWFDFALFGFRRTSLDEPSNPGRPTPAVTRAHGEAGDALRCNRYLFVFNLSVAHSISGVRPRRAAAFAAYSIWSCGTVPVLSCREHRVWNPNGKSDRIPSSETARSTFSA